MTRIGFRASFEQCLKAAAIDYPDWTKEQQVKHVLAVLVPFVKSMYGYDYKGNELEGV